MNIEIPIVVAVTLFIANIGAFVGCGRMLASSIAREYKQRFDAQEAATKQRIESQATATTLAIDAINQANKSATDGLAGSMDRLAKSVESIGKQTQRIEYELPREYMRREDHNAAMGTVNAKMDAVYAQQAHLLTIVSRMEGKLTNG